MEEAFHELARHQQRCLYCRIFIIQRFVYVIHYRHHGSQVVRPQAGGTYRTLGQNCFYFLFNRSYLSSYLFLYTLGGLRAYSGQQHVRVHDFLSMMVMVAFTVMYAIYRKVILGLFAVPISIIVMAYAAVFPQEVQPLIPSLQSNYLKIHVTLAALGESFFAVGFAAGLMYLLRTVNFSSKEKADRKQQRLVEFTLFNHCYNWVSGFCFCIPRSRLRNCFCPSERYD